MELIILAGVFCAVYWSWQLFLYLSRTYGKPSIRWVVEEFCFFDYEYVAGERKVFLAENKSKYKLVFRPDRVDGWVRISYLGDSKRFAVFSEEELCGLRNIDSLTTY